MEMGQNVVSMQPSSREVGVPTRRIRNEAKIVLKRPATMSAMRPPTSGTVQQTPGYNINSRLRLSKVLRW